MAIIRPEIRKNLKRHSKKVGQLLADLQIVGLIIRVEESLGVSFGGLPIGGKFDDLVRDWKISLL